MRSASSAPTPVFNTLSVLMIVVAVLSTISINNFATSYVIATNDEHQQNVSQGVTPAHDTTQRELQSGAVPTTRSEFINMCQDTYVNDNPNRLYRDDYSETIFNWVESDLIASPYEWDSSLLNNVSSETTHLPNYHRLPENVRNIFETSVCPYYLNVTPRTAHRNSYKMRYCRNPPRYNRTPAGIYMPMRTLKRNTNVLNNILNDMCGTIYDNWDIIRQECIERWENDGLIKSRNGIVLPPPTSGDEEEYDEVRFSKIRFIDPGDEQMYGHVLPLTSNNYPLDQSTYASIRHSTAVSPVQSDDHQVVKQRSISDYITTIMKGPPPHPSKNINDEFWVYFRHVLELQIHRRQYGDDLVNKIFPVPDLWKGFTCNESAEAVHDEYPGYWQAHFISDMIAKKEAKIDRTIIPQRANTDFVNTVVSLAHLNTWSIDAIAATSFCTKWAAGRARPEEVAWKITTGEMMDGVPSDVRTKVLNMKLTKMEEFTAYPEGCPGHPSWPAMHSAASSLSLWLPVVLDLTDEQFYQAKLTDHAVAYSRSVAGVHYHDDNLAGLNLGQELIAELLPDYLALKYGSDRDTVQRKVNKYRFDWFDFDRDLFTNQWPELGIDAASPVQKVSPSSTSSSSLLVPQEGRNRSHNADEGNLFE